MIVFNDNELEEINDIIHRCHNLDLRNYAKSSLSRRFSRIMTINALSTRQEFENYIENLTDLNRFIEEVTVNTTEMFRDPSFWKVLRTEILPELNTHENISIWHAGCSSGEEVISMQILLRELGIADKVRVIACDIDSAIIDKAQKRNYSLKNFELNEMNYKNAGGLYKLEDYFEKSDAISYTFKESLLTNIVFKKFDLVKDTMYSKFDLILCRNVLIYFDFVLQEKVIQKFISSLFSRGYLAIGQKETILNPNNLNSLQVFDTNEKIYRLNR